MHLKYLNCFILSTGVCETGYKGTDCNQCDTGYYGDGMYYCGTHKTTPQVVVLLHNVTTLLWLI